ncbi:MAG: hypothetical protein M0Q23_05845 [Syntrophales bacterium]|jgi:vacuolar-type H+-ATPase subunit E/Vma4|nr:hypothetical protein [Syntrophales bacterium]MCK9528157.1 hypothetical protein [Syntrophales bacterium]MDX9921127.1 hypothetical protein [Syntrophales bacterium]
MENSSLENSIREEAHRAIEAVRGREALELKQLDESHTADIDRRLKEVEADITERLEWERSRIANRGILEKRKLRLRAVEDLTEGCVEKSFRAIGSDPRYRDFLLRFITGALERVPGEARVMLRGEDLGFRKDIEKAMAESGRTAPWTIEEDKTLQRGGALVEDREDGRILNGAVDRIYFRKSAMIRREVMDVLKKHGFTE